MSDPGAIDRYHRQRILPAIGDEGQAAMGRAHVLLIGMGALGCQVADLLVRAGIGTLTCIDRDVVELTNLQRQTLYCEADAQERLPKVEAAAKRLRAINSGVVLRPIAADFSARNARSVFAAAAAEAGPVHLIMDGTDNFETRYLINDLSVMERVPYIYGGVIGTRAMAMALGWAQPMSPCLRCVFPDPPPPGSQPTCDTAGVLGAAVAAAAAWQVSLAMQLLTGHLPEQTVLQDGDLWLGAWRAIRVAKQADCPCCGASGRFEFLESEHARPAELCGSGAYQVWPASGAAAIDLELVAARLTNAGTVVRSVFMLRFTAREGAVELSLFPDGRSIVRGVKDAAAARGAYARYVGA